MHSNRRIGVSGFFASRVERRCSGVRAMATMRLFRPVRLMTKKGLLLELQIFIDEKPSYYDFANDTVKMTGAEFITMMTAGAKKD